jgi:microcystin degradation protein MlrC
MPVPANPRIAVLGFSIECNKFAPPATEAHFQARTYLEGDAILEEARRPTPTMLPETPGFVTAMDKAGPWTPIGIVLAMSEPNGPVEHGFFEEVLTAMSGRLNAVMPVDGVYFCAHGAAITTEEDDPEGVMFERIRDVVGPDVPVVATFDLHANVSDRMVDKIDAFIGYRTNPHLDMRERGEEAADAATQCICCVLS